MARAVAFMLIATALASCGSPQSAATSDSASSAPSLSDQRWEAKQALEAALRDSGSAKYGEVAAFQHGESYIFCGRVNAKNAFGGYTGFQRFIAMTAAATVDDGGSEFQTAWSEMCAGPSRTGWY